MNSIKIIEFLALTTMPLINPTNYNTHFLGYNCKSIAVCKPQIEFLYYSKKNSAKEKIQRFKHLKKNWNTYGADPISESVINTSLEIVELLTKVQDVFPTGRNSIQFEYDKKNGDYLEIEIFENEIIYLLSKNGEETSKSIDKKDIDELVKSFYA